VEGSSCEAGTCVGQLPNGSACSRGPQCQTGFCANIGEGVLEGEVDGAGGEGAGGAASDPGTDSPGVCCDEACQGTCSGCKASIKGFGSDGICEFVKNNTDPANDCEPAADDKCGLDGQCNGSGACRLAPSGTACGQTSCQGNSVLGQSCNGQGDCINNQGGVDCAPYICKDVAGAFQCTQPCADDNDCRDGYFCEEATCKKKLPKGQVCETSGVCDSGYCVDGVCCDASCNGQCEACNSPGSEGVCSAVQGAPVGNRAQCDHAGEECGGACDGVNVSACKYAATGTSCGETTCNNGLASSSECNGQGECRANTDVECSPYVCGEDDACLTRCEIDADCSQGYACDETTQRCLPSVTAAECSTDRQSSVGSNGITTPCKPFLCVPASGTCAVSCAASTDCAPEFVCEPSTKTCLPAPPDAGTGEEEGCACRAAGAPSRSSNHYLALVALGAALTGLRRRRQRRYAAE
jgi:MYXO-CTERM domain-containing protein